MLVLSPESRTMLSNWSFIRRNGKRKVNNKLIEPRSHKKSTSSTDGSSRIAPPVVLDINEDSLAAQRSPVVELRFPNSDEEWFPRDLLKSRSGSPESTAQRTEKATVQNVTPVAQNILTRETQARASSTPSPPLSSENVNSVTAARKKSIPAPIVIPNPDYLMPNVQIGHSAALGPVAPPGTSQPKANDAPMGLPSPSASENLSSVSGTTLARALMASSFVLSSVERHGSRHRSGVARQDSATLPRGSFFLSDSGSLSPVPPVPPVPTSLTNTSPEPKNPPESKYPVTLKSGASTESEYPVSDSYITSPEMAIGAIMSRRMMTRIKGTPLPTPPTSFKAPAPPPSAKPQRKAGHVPPRSRAPKNGVFDGPKTAVEVPLPLNSQDTSREGSVIASSDDRSLDDFDFVPPESVAVTSPESDSSASYIVPFAPLFRGGDTNRGTRKRRVGGGNLAREYSRDIAQMDNSTTSQQVNGIPSAAVSEHDYGELLNYDLTVSPELGTSSGTSAGYQTFPETPLVFSPLWSAGYSFAKPDNPVVRRRLSSQKSASHRSGKLHASTKTTRRQVGNNGGVVRRSRSSLVPKPTLSSPKRAGSKVLPAVPLNDDTSLQDETSRPSMPGGTEPQPSGELLSVPRAHPFLPLMSSNSCVLEKEALQALAKYPRSSLLSIIMADSRPLIDQATVPVSVIDPSDNSPISIPTPESSKTPPSDSLSSAGSSTEASSSPSPLHSSNSTTSTAITQSHSSKSPSSSPSPSLRRSSFLSSPPPPTSLDEPLPPVIVSALAAVDKLVSELHSPSPSFIPPPPYHAVASERIMNPSPTRTPPMSRNHSTDAAYQRSRQASNNSLPGSVRSRARSRPPLPIGPRKPSGPGQAFGSLFSGVRRNGSTSSVGSGDGSGFAWRKLYSAASQPPPKFQEPPPRWRGLTLEAAQWTFTTAQLQEIVSQAIQQSSEGSSLRYLRPDVLNGEIADEMTRLELQHLDVRAQYKSLVRKKWILMGALAGHIEGADANDVTTAARTLEELSEVLLSLDQLADKMHDVVLQMAQLKSLRDVHNTSALAMAVRKINGLFVRQMAEKERLQHHMDALGTERDEAWQHAEELAQDYDRLHDRVAGEGGPCGDTVATVNNNTDTASLTSSRRSMRISAVRKSSVRLSQAGLRSRSKHRPARPSSNLTRPTSPALEDIPPVPRLAIRPTAFPLSTGVSFGSMTTAAEVEVGLAQAQRDVYEMLGLSLPSSQASSRRRTLSGPNTTRSSSPRSRPVSESLDRVWSRQELGTRATSVILDNRCPVLPLAVARY